VSDFVLLVVPASLLALPLLDLFGLFQNAIAKEQIGYDIARYAALADVDSAQAKSYLSSRDPDGSLAREVTSDTCSLVFTSKISRRLVLWPEVIEVPIEARAECEK
jgi:hypothetical protein